MLQCHLLILVYTFFFLFSPRIIFEMMKRNLFCVHLSIELALCIFSMFCILFILLLSMMPILAFLWIWVFLYGTFDTSHNQSSGRGADANAQQHNLALRDATQEDQEQLEKLTNNPECPICWNNIKERCWEHVLPSDQDICMTSCQHIFHYVCIKKAILQNSLCPICRKYLKAKVLKLFYRSTQGKKKNRFIKYIDSIKYQCIDYKRPCMY